MLLKSKLNKDHLTIQWNNLVVRSIVNPLPPEKVLLLLPICIKNKNCSRRIADDISQCIQCGSCLVGELLPLRDQYGIKVCVVSGGTAARVIAKQLSPALIIAVACERELITGIRDVGETPVMGILNELPNGPCNQTTVDLQLIYKALDHFILQSSQSQMA